MKQKTIMLWLTLVLSAASCYAQVQGPNIPNPNRLFEIIGNFSLEVLYHTSKTLEDGQNFFMSPFIIWNALAAIIAGASGNTTEQIRYAIRWRTDFRQIDIKNLIEYIFKMNTDTVLTNFNTMFIDKNRLPLNDYQELAEDFQMEVQTLDFTDRVYTANAINNAISKMTHGLIKKIVEPDYFQNQALVLSSSLFFRGQWTTPFNASSTSRMPFYDSNGQKIGEVNMMYNRFTYPFSNMRQLQARVIELPYGKENKLSMLIMLPYPGVSVEDMFKNFLTVNLKEFFKVLNLYTEEYAGDEIDCFLPRFKVESDLNMTNVLHSRFGITDVFDSNKARLPHIARTPLYVSNIFHLTQIEVSEEGIAAHAETTEDEFGNLFGVAQFQANRPFTFMIVEKVTNSILFGGFYKKPSLY